MFFVFDLNNFKSRKLSAYFLISGDPERHSYFMELSVSYEPLSRVLLKLKALMYRQRKRFFNIIEKVFLMVPKKLVAAKQVVLINTKKKIT